MEAQEKPYRVFVVEDDLDLRLVFQSVLSAVHPYLLLEWASSAEAAVDLLENKIGESSGSPFELIVADIFLEGTATGLDFWRLCQLMYPEIPLIVTSGMSVEKFTQIIGEGITAPPFLAKPFSLCECQRVFEGVTRA